MINKSNGPEMSAFLRPKLHRPEVCSLTERIWRTLARKSFSSEVVEGLKRKINLTTRKAYRYRSFEVQKISLFDTRGKLPEPDFTHRF